MTRRDEVLVIGAGPAGIACAAALEKAGIACCVIDQAHVIGSTWDSLYPSLKLNTSRFYSHMPGMKFPLRYGIYASARQYYDYLLDYVARHDFNIRLGVRVERVAPAAGWLAGGEQRRHGGLVRGDLGERAFLPAACRASARH